MDNNQKLGNEENMSRVMELMHSAEQVRQGDKLQEGVPINYTSQAGKVYTGVVVFKRPSMLDYMQMGGLKSEYLRQAGVVNVNLVDGTIKHMAQVLATIQKLAIKRPEWLLTPEKIEDPDVLFHVYDKYEEWENSFRTSNKAETTGDSESTDGEKTMDA